MNAASQRRLTPALAGMVVVLGMVLLVLLSGLGRKVRWEPPRPTAVLPPPTNAANLPAPLPLQDFALVWQKPLFTPDRKPVARMADGGTSLGDLTLTGVILTRGLHMALLHDKNGDRQIRLREGETMPDGSVKLVEVRARSALFDASSGRTELKLPAGAPFDDDKKGGAPVDSDNQKASSGALMSIGPTGAGRQQGQSGAGFPQRSPGNPAAPPPSNTPASFLERIRQNNQKRRAERAAASH